jgi:hypothetical protein
LADGAVRCDRCGAVHGEGFRCPHCRAVADVERGSDGRLRCKACGGARLLLDDGKLVLSGREREALRLARSSARRATAWKLGGAALLAAGALALVIAVLFVLFAQPGIMVGTLSLAASILPLLIAFGAFGRGRKEGRASDQSYREAELSAAKDIADKTSGELTAPELARALDMDEQKAELVLAELSLSDVVQRRVTENGDLAYSTRPRVRVGDSGPERATETETLEETLPAQTETRQTKSERS